MPSVEHFLSLGSRICVSESKDPLREMHCPYGALSGFCYDSSFQSGPRVAISSPRSAGLVLAAATFNSVK